MRADRGSAHLAQDAPAQQAEVDADGVLKARGRGAQVAIDGKAQRVQRQLRIVAPAGLVALARAAHALHLVMRTTLRTEQPLTDQVLNCVQGLPHALTLAVSA